MSHVIQVSTLTGLSIRFGTPIEIGINEVPLRLSDQALACLVYLAITRTPADSSTLHRLFGITRPGQFAFSINHRSHQTILIECGDGITLNDEFPLLMDAPNPGYLDGFPTVTPYAFAWAEMQKHALREALPGESPPPEVLAAQGAMAAAALRCAGHEVTPLRLSIMLAQPIHRCAALPPSLDTVVPSPYWHSRAAYMLCVTEPDQPEAIARQARLAGDLPMARRVLMNAALNTYLPDRVRCARAALSLPGTTPEDRFTLYSVLVQADPRDLHTHAARVHTAERTTRSDWMAQAYADQSEALQASGQLSAAKSAARRAARYAQRAANSSASIRAFTGAARTLSSQDFDLDAVLFLERGLVIGSSSTDFPVMAALAAELALLYHKTGSTYRASITADRAVLYAYLAEDEGLMTAISRKIRFIKRHFQ